MTTSHGVPVHLTIADWIRLAMLVFVLVGAIVGVFWRQQELIRQVATDQLLLEQRVGELEDRLE